MLCAGMVLLGVFLLLITPVSNHAGADSPEATNSLVILKPYNAKSRYKQIMKHTSHTSHHCFAYSFVQSLAV